MFETKNMSQEYSLQWKNKERRNPCSNVMFVYLVQKRMSETPSWTRTCKMLRSCNLITPAFRLNVFVSTAGSACLYSLKMLAAVTGKKIQLIELRPKFRRTTVWFFEARETRSDYRSLAHGSPPASPFLMRKLAAPCQGLGLLIRLQETGWKFFRLPFFANLFF